MDSSAWTCKLSYLGQGEVHRGPGELCATHLGRSGLDSQAWGPPNGELPRFLVRGGRSAAPRAVDHQHRAPVGAEE